MPTERRRQELLGIAALLIGVFLGLTLLPWDLTGAVGRFAGRWLRQWLGIGAVLLAVLGLGTGLAALGRLIRVTPRRFAVLSGGLVLLIPYAIAIAGGTRAYTDFPADHADWTVAQQLVGIVPGAVATGVTAIIGAAGAIVVGLLGLSALTLFTLDWHPFRRLAVTAAEPAATPASEAADEAGPLIAPVRTRSSLPEGSAETGYEKVAAERAPRRAAKERKAHPPAAATAETAAPSSDDTLVPPREGVLDKPPADEGPGTEQEFEKQRNVLEETLATFRVGGKVVDRTTGPVVTRYDVAPEPGVKVGRIVSLADDLALAMRAQSIRIVAPVPGKAAVGIEVPNPKRRVVSLRALLDSQTWKESRQALPVALGEDIEGQPVIADLTRMPHLLIAGATGSGKSVCINTLVTSLCYAHSPRTLRFLMIDPKMVELSVYQKLPHLRHPVVTDNHQAAKVFKWAVDEMKRRYELLSANRARNIVDFNRKVEEEKTLIDPAGRPTLASQAAAQAGEQLTLEPAPYGGGILPYVVLVVDELADLMMTVQGEVEKPLAILAQKARAVGIHIVLATQRPSVNVITGLIKANFPCRVAFRVSAKVDSRTILDQNGAEALLGLGDMLFLPPGKSESVRIQGAFISTDETERLMGWYEQNPWRTGTEEADILEEVAAREAAEAAAAEGGPSGDGSEGDRDPRFREAAEVCIQNQLGSTSLLQRRMSIGYGRAARIIDQLHDAGILGPPDGSRPREVLVGMDQLDEYC